MISLAGARACLPRSFRIYAALGLILPVLLCTRHLGAQPVTIGSKNFTESVILGDVAMHVLQTAGLDAIHRPELGGTRILWNALLSGDIDLYPDYTGTIIEETLAGEVEGIADLPDALEGYGLRMSGELGFNDTYAMGMTRQQATELGISSISDLRRYPDLRFGFSNEFMDRQDGWPAMRAAYQLPQTFVRGMDNDLAYRGVASGTIDVTDLYSTAAEIRLYDLVSLVDDKEHFPEYQAVYLYRAELLERLPHISELLMRLEGAISEEQMTDLNARAVVDGVPETEVGAAFVTEHFSLAQPIETASVSAAGRLWLHTQEHLILVLVSLLAAIVVSVPLGIVAAKSPRLGGVILGTVGVIYTIPSLALLVFMIPLLGIGGPPAMVALFLYSLLPIVRNTHAGLLGIPSALVESADALGLPFMAKLIQIELPLAARPILAGIQTSAVLNVGTATLGALIGAGGYGQPILTGIRLGDTALILQGAIPAAMLALLVQGAFTLLERVILAGETRRTSR